MPEQPRNQRPEKLSVTAYPLDDKSSATFRDCAARILNTELPSWVAAQFPLTEHLTEVPCRPTLASFRTGNG